MTESCPPAPLQGLNTPNYPWPASSFHDPFLFPVSETLFLHLSNSYPVLGTSSNARPLRRALLATPVLPDTARHAHFSLEDPGHLHPPQYTPLSASFGPGRFTAASTRAHSLKQKCFPYITSPMALKPHFCFFLLRNSWEELCWLPHLLFSLEREDSLPWLHPSEPISPSAFVLTSQPSISARHGGGGLQAALTPSLWKLPVFLSLSGGAFLSPVQSCPRCWWWWG